MSTPAPSNAGIASKNMYELLGNDPELDPDRATEPPTRAVDKTAQRTGKRNPGADGGAARPAAGGRGGRTAVDARADQAPRERGGNFANTNRSRAPEDGIRGDRNADRGRPRYDRGSGGRGGRGGRGARDDRHSRTGVTDHPKQVAHGWGEQTGEGEWADEKAGAAIAKQEEARGLDAGEQKPVDAEGNAPPESNEAAAAEAEPEEDTSNQKSYAEYLAEQAQKKLGLGGDLQVRKPNEGSKTKVPAGKALERNTEEEAFIAGTGGKARREREKKVKNFLDVDQSWNESAARPTDGFRGGRGGPRGGGRGGPRGDGAFRGEGRGRGRGGRGGNSDFRGGARGSFRGGDKGPNVADNAAFPTLGSK